MILFLVKDSELMEDDGVEKVFFPKLTVLHCRALEEFVQLCQIPKKPVLWKASHFGPPGRRMELELQISQI